MLLKEDGFPKGINAVVFLLYKPVGLGTREYIITERTEHLKEFFALIDRGGYPFKIGFDSCTVPGRPEAGCLSPCLYNGSDTSLPQLPHNICGTALLY